MAIQKEIWVASIIAGLFASNSFITKAFNADEYVNQGKTVHIPQAGAPSGVVKNRADLPAGVSRRTDDDITFVLDEFTTNPVHIPHADTVELSYDKRESVLRQDKLKLQDEVALSFLDKWLPDSEDNMIATTGEAVNAYTPKAVGKRCAICKADVLALMTRFDADDIPQEGRYLLLDAYMYAQLLKDLTQSESLAFLASADAQNGVVGKLFSFNIMMRSRVGLYNDDGDKKSWSAKGADDDIAAGLAWHEQSVCRALGEVKAYEDLGNPTYYGDIYSFLVRCGGRIMRKDCKGVVAIVQGIPEPEIDNKPAGGDEPAGGGGQ